MPAASPALEVPTREGDDLLWTSSTATWLRELRRCEFRGDTGTRRSGDTESVLVILSGTLDLYAGGSTWTRRGARPTPFDGRPIALYLPPLSAYGSTDGEGVVLIASVRTPPFEPARDARAAAAQKPLLPLLGSGKAFDPTTGDWRPRETFPDSPEAILPRRITRVDTATGASFERILGLEYKTRGLAVDEAALVQGVPLRCEPPRAAGYPSEAALWLELDGEVLCDGVPVVGDGRPRVLACSPARMPELVLRRGRAYALVVWAGAKPAT